MNKSNVAILSLIFLVLSSCVSNKNIAYFQNNEIKKQDVSNDFKIHYKPDDLLQILIFSEDYLAAKPFNLPVASILNTTNTVVAVPQQQTYLVDSKGQIDFPVIGKIKVGGLSSEELVELLKNELDPTYILNPTINVRIVNFKITVLGDVTRPGSYNIPNERVSLLDAIGLAGDLTISGKRNNVMIIREENGEKNQYVVDLRSNDIFTSPVFYLKQNDIVYVQHNNAAIQSASFNSNTTLFISIGSVLISLLTILTR